MSLIVLMSRFTNFDQVLATRISSIYHDIDCDLDVDGSLETYETMFSKSLIDFSLFEFYFIPSIPFNTIINTSQMNTFPTDSSIRINGEQPLFFNRFGPDIRKREEREKLKNINIFKYGATTRLTTGYLQLNSENIFLDNQAFNELVVIPDRNFNQKISEVGDSGAVCYTQDGQILGVLFAGTASGSKAFIMPIHRIIDELFKDEKLKALNLKPYFNENNHEIL